MSKKNRLAKIALAASRLRFRENEEPNLELDLELDSSEHYLETELRQSGRISQF